MVDLQSKCNRDVAFTLTVKNVALNQMSNLLQTVIITNHKNMITERRLYIMNNLAYVTLLIQSNNEDDFESKSNDVFDDTTWSQLNNLLEPSYTIRGTISKTAIHFDDDSSQFEKVKLTKKAYQEHISELGKYDF